MNNEKFIVLGKKATFLQDLKEHIDDNNGKIPKKFVDKVAESLTWEYGKCGDSCRIAVGTIGATNAKFVGTALVLDPNNDDANIGNSVCRDNATEQLWGYLGGLAKSVI